MNIDDTSHQGIAPWVVGCLVTLLVWGLLIGYYEVKFGLDFPPSATGDEPDYDSIGWELANGRGFRVNSDDPEFRQPYDQAAQLDERYRLPKSRTGLNTTRPPIYPIAIGALHRVFGRQLWATRIMDALFVAATCGLLAAWTHRRLGLTMAAVSVLLFIAVDVRTRLYGRAILTEAMSMFSVAVLFLALVHFRSSQTNSIAKNNVMAVAIGMLTGLCILIRSLMILWMPGLCLLMWWISRQQKQNFRNSVSCVAAFGAGTVLALAPWAVRNIAVTGELMPLGTQGLVQFSAAFGDQVWESHGLWRNLDQNGFFDSVLQPTQSLVESEVAKAKLSREQALNWIRSNPIKAIALFPLKIAQEFLPRNATELFILISAGMGVPAAWRTDDGRLLMALIAINSFAIGMTWSVEGRFLVPVLFPLHALAIFGAARLWKLFARPSSSEAEKISL